MVPSTDITPVIDIALDILTNFDHIVSRRLGGLALAALLEFNLYQS